MYFRYMQAIIIIMNAHDNFLQKGKAHRASSRPRFDGKNIF